jgi:cell division transport system permease protein
MTIGYLLRESISGFKRAKGSTFAAISTITIALLLLSIFAFAFINLHSIIQTMRDRIEMEVFLEDPMPADSVMVLQKQILAIEGVRTIRFVSKTEAAEIFKEEFGEDINRVLDFNPLPASFKIFLKDGYKTADHAKRIYDDVRRLKGVESGIYRRTLVELVDRRARTILTISFAIGGLIAIISIFLTANTIRLAIYAKRKSIRTIKLIGATNNFIRIPFILEGLIQGLIGGLFATGFVFSVFYGLRELMGMQFSEFVRIEPYYYGVIVLCGCFLGFVGSLISMLRFLTRELST